MIREPSGVLAAPVALLLVVGLSSLTSLGCRRRDEGAWQTVDAPSPAAPSASAAPPDHLGKGELVEGREDAYGIKLPRDLRVLSAFPNEIVAAGAPGVDAVASYLKGRVREGTMRKDNGDVVFEHVHSPAKMDRDLLIRVQRGKQGGSELRVRDVTPVPPPPGLTDNESRLRAVGLDKNGKQLHPERQE